MPVFVALLRAVNVGGTGKLPMATLRSLCEAAGFLRVETYIASGNVVFEHAGPEHRVKELLEQQLLTYAGKPVRVLVRSHQELRAVLRDNPFRDADPKQNVVIFLDTPPAPDWLSTVRHRSVERVAAGAREIFLDYAGSMAGSKLVIRAAQEGTARNMNTVAKLCELAALRARA